MEAVDRSLAELVEVEVVALARVLDGAEHEDAGSGRGADDIVDDAGALEQFVRIPELRGLHDRGAGLDGVAVAAALRDGHPGHVGDDGLLEGDLGAVGEARDHRRLLAPFLGEGLLGRRRPVGVLEALDVAAEHRPDAEALDEAPEVALDAGLVAVDVGEDHAGLVGLVLEERTEGAVELGVHQRDVLAVLDGGDDRGDRLLDGAGDLEDDVDVRAGRDQHRVLGDRRAAGLDGAGERGRAVADDGVVLAGVGVGLHGLRHGAVGDGDDADRVAVGEADLEEHARGHEARADHADADRGLAVGDVAGEGGIDEDHGSRVLLQGLVGAGAASGATSGATSGAGAASGAGVSAAAAGVASIAPTWSPRRSASWTMV